MTLIQLFSDGGVYIRHNLAISSGLMFVDKHKTLSFCKSSYNSNSDFAELFAINKLLSRAYGYCKQKDMFNGNFIINVYTDSLTSISGILSNKIPADNEKRLQLLNEIKDTISKFDNKVVFYHIRSHISGKNLKVAHIMFCKENQIDISFSEFQFLYQQNKKCDNMISKEFKKINKMRIINKKMMDKKQNKTDRLNFKEGLLNGSFKENEI